MQPNSADHRSSQRIDGMNEDLGHNRLKTRSIARGRRGHAPHEIGLSAVAGSGAVRTATP
jgi:hypothetical protein